MVTDTQRILRTDPGRPEVCNVCQLHRFFGDDYVEIQDGERTARTGCVDTKRLLAERIIAHYAPARERYLELLADPRELDEDPRRRRRPPRGRSRPATMAEVRAEDGPALDGLGDAAPAWSRRETRCPDAADQLTERQRRWLDALLVLARSSSACVAIVIALESSARSAT